MAEINDARRFERIVIAAKRVWAWYYIFGESSVAGREHLAELGNALADAGHGFGAQQSMLGYEKTEKRWPGRAQGTKIKER
jgi:hypothetical protein